jgi:glycosyltransferase involved in cell wall biosynthesis
MNGLRVCHIGKYYPPAPGGIETHTKTLARAQADLGAAVRVVCVNHERGPTVHEHDGPVAITRVERRASGLKLDYCPGLVRTLKGIDSDILHMQAPNPTMILALLAARPKLPLVVTYQSDVIHQKLRALLFRPLERWFYGKVAAIVPTSPPYATGSEFLRRYADQLRVVPMGVDLEPYRNGSEDNRAEAARIRAQHGQGGPLWLSVGRAVYYKGFVNAVRALKHIEGRLILIGDGPEIPALRAEAARLGVLDRIDFMGTLPYLKIIPYYRAADAFWFPSNARSEAFGLVQVEAMAAGCPVINTDIPASGVPWVCGPDGTGLTVPMNDPEALAAAARRILDEPGLRERLVLAARHRAEAEFDHHTMAQRTLEVYENVLTRSPAASSPVPASQGRPS